MWVTPGGTQNKKKIGTDVRLEFLTYHLTVKLLTNKIFCFTLQSINLSTNLTILLQPILKLKAKMKKAPDI